MYVLWPFSRPLSVSITALNPSTKTLLTWKCPFLEPPFARPACDDVIPDLAVHDPLRPWLVARDLIAEGRGGTIVLVEDGRGGGNGGCGEGQRSLRFLFLCSLPSLS